MAIQESSQSNKPDLAAGNDSEFCLLDHVFILRYLSKTHLTPLRVALLGFSGYYIIPLLLAACEGVLMPPAFARSQLMPFGLESAGRWLSRQQSASTYYTSDVTHLLMALTVAFAGGGFAYAALAKFGSIYTEVKSQLVFLPADFAAKEMLFLKKRADNWLPRVGFLVIAVACALFLLGRIRTSAAVTWWLSESYGPAGLALVAAVFCMCLVGGDAMYVLGVGLNSVARCFRYPVKLRPFHHDGCNGFGRFGNYLMLLLCLCILVGAALWITFRRGYLGVQEFAGVWALGLMLLVLAPIVFLEPLIRATARIRDAQTARLARVESALERGLAALEESLDKAEPAAPLDGFKNLEELHKIASSVYSANMFPFNPKFAGTLSVGYALQVYGVVKEVLDKLHK